MMWWGGDWTWWAVFPLAMVGFWAAVIWAVLAGARDRPVPPPSTPAPPPAPEEILAERFARGEIDEDGYDRRLVVLRSRRSVGDRR